MIFCEFLIFNITFISLTLFLSHYLSPYKWIKREREVILSIRNLQSIFPPFEYHDSDLQGGYLDE